MGTSAYERSTEQEKARLCATGLVLRHSGITDPAVIAPLSALTRRIVELRMGIRHRAALDGRLPFDIVFETQSEEPIDLSAQAYLGKLALDVEEKVLLSGNDTEVQATRYLLDFRLGAVFRVQLDEEHSEGRNVMYMAPGVVPAGVSPTGGFEA